MWTLIFIFISIAAVSSADQYFKIKSPDHYVALTSDLSVTLQRTVHQKIQKSTKFLITIKQSIKNETLICHDHLDFPLEKSQIDYQISCACFYEPGLYEIQIWNSNDHQILLADQKLIVRWPQIILRLPQNRTLSNGSVPLKIAFHESDQKNLCRIENRTESDYGLYISLKRATIWNEGQDVENTTHGSHWKELKLLPIKDWSKLIDFVFTLPCGLFRQMGSYEVELMLIRDQSSDQSNRLSISRSNRMQIFSPNEDYDLKIIAHYIYPCPSDKGLPISYRRPSNRGCLENRYQEVIRLYAAQPRKGDQKNLKGEEIFLESKYNYVAEEKLITKGPQAGAGVIYFGCNHFDLIYPEYCFELISIFEDGMVLQRAKSCIATQSTKYTPIQGQWSSWQSWTACTVTCGPADGVQHRLRLCNKPHPTDGGRFCSGDGLESRICSSDQICSTLTKFSIDFSTDHALNQSIHSPLASIDDDQCACGCNLSRPQGGVIAIDSHKCSTNNISYWSLIAPWKNQIIDLKILRLKFRYPDSEWMKIYEQFDESIDILLFDSSINFDDTDLQERSIIKSKANRLLIAYFPSDQSKINQKPTSIRDQKIDSLDNWYGILLRYNFRSTISKSKIDRNDQIWSWWFKIKSDRRWFLIFLISVVLLILLSLLSIYYLAAKYTLKKLRSKCNYLMLLSQTTNNSATIGTNLINDLNSPSSIRRHSTCELGSDHGKLENRSSNRLEEPLLPKIDKSKKSMTKNRFLAQIPEEIMQTSTQTEISTTSPASPNDHHSANQSISPPKSSATPKSVRSIGIQLSSPALSGIRRHTSTDRCQPTDPIGAKIERSTVAIGSKSIARPESPNFSFAGTAEDDFEYDYYDAPVPGSFFNYEHNTNTNTNSNWRSSFFETDIDIDDIIEQSDLMNPFNNNNNSSSSTDRSNGSSNPDHPHNPPSPAATMVSVSTQSHPHLLAAGESAESSEWSFKWTKPSTATTQFHFL